MINPNLAEALRTIHAARRAVALCREFEGRERLAGGNVALAEMTTAALVIDLCQAEAQAAALIGGEGYTVPSGGLITIELSERRARPRPCFVFKRGNMQTTIFGRAAQ